MILMKKTDRLSELPDILTTTDIEQDPDLNGHHPHFQSFLKVFFTAEIIYTTSEKTDPDKRIKTRQIG